MEWLKGQIDVIAGTTWWPGQVFEVNAADARVCCKESTRAAKWKQERAKKGGKEMARPYTKLAPATKTGHQDAIALARSRNDSKGRSIRVGGREMRFGESWGTFAAKTQRLFGVQQTP
jgi:hypothetical protein